MSMHFRVSTSVVHVCVSIHPCDTCMCTCVCIFVCESEYTSALRVCVSVHLTRVSVRVHLRVGVSVRPCGTASGALLFPQTWRTLLAEERSVDPAVWSG